MKLFQIEDKPRAKSEYISDMLSLAVAHDNKSSEAEYSADSFQCVTLSQKKLIESQIKSLVAVARSSCSLFELWLLVVFLAEHSCRDVLARDSRAARCEDYLCLSPEEHF